MSKGFIAAFSLLTSFQASSSGQDAGRLIPQIDSLLGSPSVLVQGNPMLGTGAAPLQPPAVQPAKSAPYESSVGPWGKLVGDYIYLEAPMALLEGFALPSTQTRWTFPSANEAAIPKIFADAGLTEDQIKPLIASLVRDGEVVHTLPPLDFVLGLPTSIRTAIYTELAKVPTNEYHVDPVLIFGSSVEEWYRTSKLRPELIQKINQLSYVRGETIAFSDIPALLNFAQSDSEARLIFKACTRTRSLMIRLLLDKNTDVQELLAYWSFGVGIRRKDIEPIIQSIIESDTLRDLGLSHILPAQPRKLLFTYPGLDMAKHGLLPDCHWTSLNFYNFDPHQYLLDSRLATSKVLENCVPVEAPYQFGDILFFLDNATGDAFHSCVLLADTLVYTKNGRNILSPWVIMTIDDVKKIYLFRGNGRVQGFRRKDIQEARQNTTAGASK
ncbi:MAG: hypothetical protein IPK22_18315 [Verrucomicrobiaceae bacterium]|nr:hypothetical protein [Verrucomicrobiaceae bacterium]